MQVEEVRPGRSWRLWEGGREVGVVLIARVRSARPLYGPYSAAEGGKRWELGVTCSVEEAVSRIVEFDPAKPGVRTQVDSEVIDRQVRPKR